MFWCVSWAGVRPLVQVDGSLDGVQYAGILQHHIPQVKAALGRQSAYIIEDDASIHGTDDVRRAKDFLRLTDLGLSSYSPDLNIIENVWGILKRRIKNRAPESREELILVSLEEWGNITLEEIRTLFRSMPKRLIDVINRQEVVRNIKLH